MNESDIRNSYLPDRDPVQSWRIVSEPIVVQLAVGEEAETGFAIRTAAAGVLMQTIEAGGSYPIGAVVDVTDDSRTIEAPVNIDRGRGIN